MGVIRAVCFWALAVGAVFVLLLLSPILVCGLVVQVVCRCVHDKKRGTDLPFRR